jgi:hypothetical protein
MWSVEGRLISPEFCRLVPLNDDIPDGTLKPVALTADHTAKSPYTAETVCDGEPCWPPAVPVYTVEPHPLNDAHVTTTPTTPPTDCTFAVTVCKPVWGLESPK